MTKWILLALLLCACATQRLQHGIPNLRLVEPGVYRGGQPQEAGWRWLRQQGVTNVVKLNGEEGAWPPDDIDMDLVAIDITIWMQLSGEHLKAAIPLAVSHIKPGTFVHCSRGEDRTGLVVAMYRRQRGWTKAAAEREMLRCGFHKSLAGLWNYWEKQ